MSCFQEEEGAGMAEEGKLIEVRGMQPSPLISTIDDPLPK